MLNIVVIRIKLEIVKKFISDIAILLNFNELRFRLQLVSLMFIRRVGIVIRTYTKIIRIVKTIITVGSRNILLNRRA